MSKFYISIFKTLNRKQKSPFIIFLIGILLILSALFVYSSGGTKGAYLHIFYIPIILASFAFGLSGGISVSILSGLILGPLMPFDVKNAIPQETFSWIYRMGFFLFVSTIVGVLANTYRFQTSSLSKMATKLSRTYVKELVTLASIIEQRDKQTGGHCERVGYNSFLIGKELKMDKNLLNLLFWSGLLHDLGKIGVPDSILLKPDKLTELEFDEVKKHSELGAELLYSISPDFKLIAQGVRTHHERWDGKGYPSGLSEENIPIFGRIIAVSDIFEALTSKRPYQMPLSDKEAVDYIKKQSGYQFDPRIVSIFIKLYTQDKIFVSETPPDLSRHFSDYNPLFASNTNLSY